MAAKAIVKPLRRIRTASSMLDLGANADSNTENGPSGNIPRIQQQQHNHFSINSGSSISMSKITITMLETMNCCLSTLRKHCAKTAATIFAQLLLRQHLRKDCTTYTRHRCCKKKFNEHVSSLYLTIE